MALTLNGTTGIVFNDSTVVSTAFANNDVLKVTSLITNYSTVTPTIIDTTSTSCFVQNYGVGGSSASQLLGSPWSKNNKQEKTNNVQCLLDGWSILQVI